LLSERAGAVSLFGAGSRRSRHADRSRGSELIFWSFAKRDTVQHMFAVFQTAALIVALTCVWLTVRIVNRRERWAMWTAVFLVLLAILGYLLSIGPAAIWATQHRVKAADFTRFYAPLRMAANECVLLDEFLDWYTDTCWDCWAAIAGSD
jgi:hypothetical protein